MRTLLRFNILLTLLFWWNMVDSLFAQEITLSGVGPINHSLAGTAVALPRDSAGAMQWNPATISFLEQSEFQLGMGRHNATWYGDEYVAGTVAIGAVVALLIYSAVSDEKIDTYEREKTRKSFNDDGWIAFDIGPSFWILLPGSSAPDYSRPPPEHRQNSSTIRAPKSGVIRVPTISYAYQRPDSRWSFGLAVSEYGAKKIGALAIGNMVGICEYRFQGYEFIPTFAYRESRRLSFGLSPIFSIGGC